MQQQISMFFRNARRMSVVKRKSEKMESEKNEGRESVKIVKGSEDDDVSKQRKINLLKKSREREFSKETFKKLVDDTFTYRREYIQHEAKSAKDILNECPFLVEPQHVSKLAKTRK